MASAFFLQRVTHCQGRIESRKRFMKLDKPQLLVEPNSERIGRQFYPQCLIPTGDAEVHNPNIASGCCKIASRYSGDSVDARN